MVMYHDDTARCFSFARIFCNLFGEKNQESTVYSTHEHEYGIHVNIGYIVNNNNKFYLK